MQVSCEQVRGEKKSNRKSDCSGKRRKIEHPPLLCQSVSSVKHCSVCCSPHGVQGPFHLTWLCKRFSQRPKGGECQGLDKVPSICLMGPAGRRARWGEGWGQVTKNNWILEEDLWVWGTDTEEAESLCMSSYTFTFMIAILYLSFLVDVNVSLCKDHLAMGWHQLQHLKTCLGPTRDYSVVITAWLHEYSVLMGQIMPII